MDSNLGDRLSVRIDPTWPHRNLWRHPLGDTLRFTYVDFPSGISESASPNYSDSEVMGRAEPYTAFGGTSGREVTLTFVFQAQGLVSGLPDEQTIMNEVVLPMRWLDALKYGLYDPASGNSFAAPPVIVKIGQLFTGRCQLTGGDMDWDYESMDVDSLLPHAGRFPATFRVVRQLSGDLSYFPSGAQGGPISGLWQ